METYSVEAYLKATGADKFAKEFGNATKNVDGMERSTGKARIGIGKLVAAAGGLVVLKKGFDMVTSSIDGAISRYDTLNTFPKVLEQIGFSASDSEKSIKKLSDGTKGLPTALDEVAKTTQRIAVLTNDLDKATDTTLALNNAFLASGSSSADASRGLDQYVQMLSKGEVDLQSWRTLQETMGVALNDVAKSFGFAGASAQNDLYDALKEGDITFDEFNGKLVELSDGTNGFAERARTASGGIATSFANMRTAITRGVANIIGSIDELLTSNGLPNLETMINNVGSKFEGALNKVAGLISSLNGKFKDFSSISDFLVGAFNTVVQEVPKIISNIVETIVANLPTLMTSGARIILTIVQAIVENMPTLIQSGMQIIQTIIMGFNQILPEFIMAIISLLQAILNTVVENLDLIVNTGVTLINALIQGLMGSIDVVIGSVQMILATLIQAITENLPTILQAGITMLLALIDGIVAQLPDLIDMAVELIIVVVDTVVSNLPMIIDAAVQIIIALINGLVRALPQLLSAVFVIVVKLVGAILRILPQVLGAGLKIVWELIKGIGSLLGNIIKIGGDLVMSVIKGITGFFSKIFNSGKELAGKALDGLLNIRKKFLDAGKNIVGSIVDGIKSKVGAVKDAIGNITQKIRDFLPFSPAKEGALRDIMDVKVVDFVLDNINKSKNKAKTTIGKFTKIIEEGMPSTNFGGIVNGINQRVQRQMNHTINGEVNITKQPAYINLAIGRREFEYFVEDISEVQERKTLTKNAFV